MTKRELAKIIANEALNACKRNDAGATMFVNACRDDAWATTQSVDREFWFPIGDIESYRADDYSLDELETMAEAPEHWIDWALADLEALE